MQGLQEEPRDAGIMVAELFPALLCDPRESLASLCLSGPIWKVGLMTGKLKGSPVWRNEWLPKHGESPAHPDAGRGRFLVLFSSLPFQKRPFVRSFPRSVGCESCKLLDHKLIGTSICPKGRPEHGAVGTGSTGLGAPGAGRGPG